MPAKELHHLRRTVEAAKRLVKKPVLTYQEAEADQANERQRPTEQQGERRQ